MKVQIGEKYKSDEILSLDVEKRTKVNGNRRQVRREIINRSVDLHTEIGWDKKGSKDIS